MKLSREEDRADLVGSQATPPSALTPILDQSGAFDVDLDSTPPNHSPEYDPAISQEAMFEAARREISFLNKASGVEDSDSNYSRSASPVKRIHDNFDDYNEELTPQVENIISASIRLSDLSFCAL